MRPPKVRPFKNWEAFKLPFQIGSGRSFLPDKKGQANLRMAFFRRKEDGALVGRVWFGLAVEGPPGFVHGGVSAYVLDEAMGSAGSAGFHEPCGRGRFIARSAHALIDYQAN